MISSLKVSDSTDRFSAKISPSQIWAQVTLVRMKETDSTKEHTSLLFIVEFKFNIHLQICTEYIKYIHVVIISYHVTCCWAKCLSAEIHKVKEFICLQMFERETKREKILEARQREIRLKERSRSEQSREEDGGREDGEDSPEQLIARAERDFYSVVGTELKKRRDREEQTNPVRTRHAPISSSVSVCPRFVSCFSSPFPFDWSERCRGELEFVFFTSVTW